MKQGLINCQPLQVSSTQAGKGKGGHGDSVVDVLGTGVAVVLFV